MRIMHICQSYEPMISGASLAVARLARGMAKEGNEVLVVAASDRREGYTRQHGRLQVERLPSLHNPARVGQRVLVYPRRQLQRLVTQFGPDVIHLHEPLLLGICGLKAARWAEVPVVLTLHQLPWFVTKYSPTVGGVSINVERLLWRYGRWFLRKCDAAIVTMGPIADVVKQQCGVMPTIIPYGTSMGQFNGRPECLEERIRLRQKYGLEEDLPIILHTGRLDMDKDVDRVIEAAARVMREVDAQLFIVGDGRRKQALMRQCQDLGIAERCRFAGFVAPDGDLPALYKLASLFVTASEIETFGIVILEAMASARPVVAVNATCIPRLVEDGASGLLAAPGDVEGMAEKMIWLLRNAAEAEAMGRRGRSISRQYDEQAMLQRHLSLYRSLIWPQFVGVDLSEGAGRLSSFV